MTAVSVSKELAARQRDGLSVVLRWHPREDAVTVVEATITARVEPGRVRAELALAR